jgi:hypothetical protein
VHHKSSSILYGGTVVLYVLYIRYILYIRRKQVKDVPFRKYISTCYISICYISIEYIQTRHVTSHMVPYNHTWYHSNVVAEYELYLINYIYLSIYTPNTYLSIYLYPFIPYYTLYFTRLYFTFQGFICSIHSLSLDPIAFIHSHLIPLCTKVARIKCLYPQYKCFFLSFPSRRREGLFV